MLFESCPPPGRGCPGVALALEPMAGTGDARDPALDDEQRRVVEHRAGPLVLTGPAGSGKSEALARRVAARAESGIEPERTLVFTRTPAAASWLRRRVETLLAVPFEELWIGTYAALCERLLREYATDAGLDPFFETVGAADRLAILLERIDELPLRRQEIRGNPAGLLARLLERIDALKGEGVSPDALRTWATDLERDATDGGGHAQRDAARREIEFAELFARHDAIVRDAGSLDSIDLVNELARLAEKRADVRERLAERFTEVIADELEDAGPPQERLLEALSAEHGNLVVACDELQAIRPLGGPGSLSAFLERHEDAERIGLTAPRRGGGRLARAAAAVTDRDIGQAGGAAGAVRFWRSATERAEAQAAARDIEQLLATGDVRPDDICIVTGSVQREGRVMAAALEERSVPFRLTGHGAFFQRPEIRDALAWLRVLADPNDAPAAVRALTRPPIELRSVDLARCTLIARRRKLDMVSALEAAIESPQLPPEARDRIQAFLRLHRGAAGALEQLRADVFVRRLIERIGLRRQQLFAASPETAERLVSLSKLGDLAAAFARREPRASTRDFVRYVVAVAEAGELGDDPPAEGPAGGILLAEPEQVKGLEFDHLYLLDLRSGAMADRPSRDDWIPEALRAMPEPGEDTVSEPARLAYLAMTRARRSLVLSHPETRDGEAVRPSSMYEAVRAELRGDEQIHEEELFGPAEGLHSTYRMVRDDVLETSWRAGGTLGEMRLDVADDVNKAVARFLELVKLAALIQRPAEENVADSIEAVNQLIAQAATSEQRAALEASALDSYLLEGETERARRRDLVAARQEPSLEAFIPRRGNGLGLSASDIDLYRTCPLKYKFARVFAIPEEPTINQRFGILIHRVLERFHSDELRDAGGSEGEAGLDRLLALFEAGWRRTGFGSSDDELQFRDRAVAALTRYWERHNHSPASPVWLERGFNFEIGDHQLRGRIDRVDKLADGGYELIDYKTGDPNVSIGPSDDLQIALYRLGAREAWNIDAEIGSYWYVLADEKVQVPSLPDDRERVERTVLEVAEGIQGQDFEPRPSYEVCSWCDYRVTCPASEA
jgi:DNA helicase II / ATP-dependent DNA helicase PcrA